MLIERLLELPHFASISILYRTLRYDYRVQNMFFSRAININGPSPACKIFYMYLYVCIACSRAWAINTLLHASIYIFIILFSFSPSVHKNLAYLRTINFFKSVLKKTKKLIFFFIVFNSRDTYHFFFLLLIGHAAIWFTHTRLWKKIIIIGPIRFAWLLLPFTDDTHTYIRFSLPRAKTAAT